MSRPRRTFEPIFKKQIVALYKSGTPKATICKKYNLARSVLDRWIKKFLKEDLTKFQNATEKLIATLQTENSILKKQVGQLEREVAELNKDMRTLSDAYLIITAMKKK